ncbi:MAG: serine/threonine-protein kinase [Polyangiales bacterium]
MTTEAPGATTGALSVVALKAGDVLGERYEIVRVLGQGGMGTVYEARHKILGRPVAIKVLKPEVAYNEQFSARFLQEAKSAAELHHRNIVELTDYGFFGDQPYMVMEFLRGESLDSLLEREGPLSPGRAVALIEPVLRALAMAHERGIVHRDIKPDNIFLVDDSDGGEPTPKVVDFGIAKRQTTEENVQLTTATMALGTPAYMSPEQIMASKNATGAADQYAVGVTLYECLTGRYPFDADTINAFIVAKATQEAIPLQSLRPDLDPGLCAVVMRTLARKPEDRFANISALREALLPWKGVDGPAGVAPGSATLGGVKAPGPSRPSAATAMRARPTSPRRPSSRRGRRAPHRAPSSTGKWIGVGVAALAVLGLGGFAATRLGRGASSTLTSSRRPRRGRSRPTTSPRRRSLRRRWCSPSASRPPTRRSPSTTRSSATAARSS